MKKKRNLKIKYNRFVSDINQTDDLNTLNKAYSLTVFTAYVLVQC